MNASPHTARRSQHASTQRGGRTVPAIARLLVVAAAILCLATLWLLHRAITTPETVDLAATEWNLVLVNKDHALPFGFSVDTVEMPGGERVDARIADSLSALLEDAETAGFHPFIRSGFRTREQQGEILDQRIEEYEAEGYPSSAAREEALSWVAEPGTSEHELGLAVDINDAYGDDGLYDWLRDNAPAYGFIQRYPPDKSDITHISHEPWHYRYVGTKAAAIIYRNNLTLEEYLAQTP